MDLVTKLWETSDLLKKALEEYKVRGKNYAVAYANYRKLLAQKILKLKAEGMATTILGDVARGDEEVANAKQQEIITETLYESCKEAINGYKLQIKILQEQINKEWGAE